MPPMGMRDHDGCDEEGPVADATGSAPRRGPIAAPDCNRFVAVRLDARGPGRAPALKRREGRGMIVSPPSRRDPMSAPSAEYQPPANTRELVTTWLRRARESKVAHYEMADRLGRRASWFGLPVILITVVVGTSSFASIAEGAVSTSAKIAVGLLSVLATILSALQTFFKFSERAEKHRRCGAQYGAVERELEATIAEEGASIDALYVASMREKLDQLAEDAPHVPWQVFVEDRKSLQAEAKRNNALAKDAASAG